VTYHQQATAVRRCRNDPYRLIHDGGLLLRDLTDRSVSEVDGRREVAELKDGFSDVKLDDHSLSSHRSVAALELENAWRSLRRWCTALARKESRGSTIAVTTPSVYDKSFLKHSLSFRSDGRAEDSTTATSHTKLAPGKERVYGGSH